MDPARHKELTGAGNERILENLDHAAERLRGPGRPHGLWIRTPIIPGATDDEANILAIGRRLARLGEIVDRWDLCAFNNLARDKYARLGMSWPFDQAKPMRKEDMERLTETARRSGVDPAVVQWGGGARIENPADGIQAQCG
jgi:pyruvate formate lyase activating enzyme